MGNGCGYFIKGLYSILDKTYIYLYSLHLNIHLHIYYTVSFTRKW